MTEREQMERLAGIVEAWRGSPSGHEAHTTRLAQKAARDVLLHPTTRALLAAICADGKVGFSRYVVARNAWLDAGRHDAEEP